MQDPQEGEVACRGDGYGGLTIKGLQEIDVWGCRCRFSWVEV